MEKRVRVSVLVPWCKHPAAKLVESVFLGIGGGWTREVAKGAWLDADGRVIRDDHWRYVCDLKPSVVEDLAGGLEAFVEAFAADVARAAGELETYVTVERVLVASVPPRAEVR